MPYILLGEPAFKLYADTLFRCGFTPISLPPEANLSTAVRTHADTLIWSDGTTHIANSEYISRLPSDLRSYITEVSDAPYGEYPNDTVFNALRVGRYLFARTASLALSVRQAAQANGLEIVNVNQGYAKCSTLALSAHGAAVTADEGMAKAMESRGIRVLRITPGYIALDGCEYGFIGGASFVYEPLNCCSIGHEPRRVFFFGSLRTHPDAEAITHFLSQYGYEAVSLEGRLTDFGGAIIVTK